MRLRRVISSGQTGVERAALDSAIHRLVYSWGGWVPKGKLAEDGEIDEVYFSGEMEGSGLAECDRSRDFTARYRNIRDADATLILRSSSRGSTLPQSVKLIIKTCRKLEKPYRMFDPSRPGKVPAATRWICETQIEEGESRIRPIEILNVVGPRESHSPGIYDKTLTYMNDVLGFVFTNERWGIKIWAPQRNKRKDTEK